MLSRLEPSALAQRLLLLLLQYCDACMMQGCLLCSTPCGFGARILHPKMKKTYLSGKWMYSVHLLSTCVFDCLAEAGCMDPYQ